MATTAKFVPPEQFEEYRIVRLLGGGAMGQVYLAHDTLLDRPVAIKFIANLEEQVLETELRERFFIEARAIARLQHPNVVLIYRVGEWQRRPYLVSEFVRGQSLDRMQKPLPWSRVHRIGIGLSRGLAAAHRRGVLHRDIKPANTMLTGDGEVKILDFGLAKLVDSTQALRVSDSQLPATTASAQQETAPLHDTQQDLPIAPGGELAETVLSTRGGREVPALAATLASSASLAARVQASADASHAAGVVASMREPAGPRVPSTNSAPEAAPSSGNVALDATILPSGQTPAKVSGLLPSSMSAERTSASLTHVGDVLGSPLYMAPEIWRGEPATRQADIYSLGTVLYELCAGHAPHEGVPLPELPLRVQDHDARSLAEVAPDADPRFCAIVDRCLRRSPQDRFESGDSLRAALEQLSGSAQALHLPQGNPYRGLSPFDAQHKDLFFGRAADISAVLDRLRSEPILIVAGNSGVGKSSLVRAGVLPQVEGGVLGPMRVVTIVPGKRALSALAAALASTLELDEHKVARDLAEDPQALARSLRQRNRQGSSPRCLLLFVDQLEELLTVSEDASRFGEVLAALTAYAPDIRLLATVRSDFLSRLVTLPGIGTEVSRSLHLISPLGGDALREVITQPALAMGYAFESAALVESLVSAASQSDGSLPLLQFTLSLLWEAREPGRRIIPAVALAALGGVGGALARHADAVYERLSPKQRAAARRILGQLITVEGTRARRRRQELIGGSVTVSGHALGLAHADAREDAIAALDALTAGRIVSVRADESGAGSAYELAHESLLTSWGSLRAWLAEDASLRALRQRLTWAAIEWERFGHTRDLLWRRRQLSEAVPLSMQILPPQEARFLKASRRALRMRRIASGLLLASIPAMLALLYVAATLRARENIARQIREHAAAAKTALQSARTLSVRSEQIRQDAYRAFDDRKQSQGELLWDQMRALQAEEQQQFRRAIGSAEAAFLIDSRRYEQRELVATVLFEQAQAAERDNAVRQRDDLIQRLALYDRDGSFRRKWETPASLDIVSDPPGAQVSLTPIDGQYQLHREKTVQLGLAPLSRIRMAPGAYLLDLRSPGRVDVKYPVLLDRGEALPLNIFLPARSDIPEGYAYIPAGRFLFGSHADDDMRRTFFGHVPQHKMWTGAFVISRNETTFADWLHFLRALPADERQRRLPRAGTPGSSSSLSVIELPDGSMEFVVQPSDQVHRARESSPIVYPGRKHHSSQDWRRMPVTGITHDDAAAYTSWLAASRQVRNARLCSEVEWERAARGADDRLYPHGNRVQADDANFDQTYLQLPQAMGLDEVGSHPASRSLFGVDDLFGNAYEWVTNAVSERQVVLRGGAFYYDAITGRSDNRHEPEPGLRNSNTGMRVCASIKSLL